MQRRSRTWMPVVGAAIGCLLAASAANAQQATGDAQVSSPGCHFGEVVDGSTADDARARIEAAGFTDVHGLKKSCDNFWHGQARLSGQLVNVVLTPTGKVILEGN